MYSEYYRMRTGKNHLELFKAHSTKFKKVLDNIISTPPPVNCTIDVRPQPLSKVT